MIPYNLQLKPPLGMPLNRGHKLAEGIVGLWLMNEGVGSQVFDLSGNGNTGELEGTAHFVPGQFGFAIDLDGDSDFVSAGDPSVVDFGAGNFGLGVWIKRGRSSTREVVIGKDSVSGSVRQFIFQLQSNDTIRIQYYVSGDSIRLDTTDTITDTLWHFLFGQRIGNSFEIYIDGILSASGTSFGEHGTMESTAIELRFGSRSGAPNTDYFQGQIDLPMIYNRALSPSEIALLFTNPFIMFKDPAETALLGGYVEVITGWFGVNSTHLDSFCGEENAPETIENALNGTHRWHHLVDETHWFIIDLGQTYNVQKVRGRSNSSNDPVDVNIYVSDDTGDWGAAVATGISTWQDTDDWTGDREIDVTNKNGQYVKVEIVDTEDAQRDLGFGAAGEPYFTIFDVYVEEEAVPPPVGMAGAMTTNAGYWGW